MCCPHSRSDSVSFSDGMSSDKPEIPASAEYGGIAYILMVIIIECFKQHSKRYELVWSNVDVRTVSE